MVSNSQSNVRKGTLAHEEWRTVGGLLVAQNFCRLCLVCTIIRGPGITLILFVPLSVTPEMVVEMPMVVERAVAPSFERRSQELER